MTELVFIGTSDAFGAGGRRQSAVLLRTGSGGVLVDCGMTTGMGMCDLGIDRVSVSLPSEDEDTLLPVLDKWAGLIREVGS